MVELDYLKYILVIVAGIIYLIFFRKSVKHIKTNKKTGESPYLGKKTDDFYDDVKAWFAIFGVALMILWSAYELYKCFA